MEVVLELTRKVSNNIKKDIVDNFIHRFPLIIIVDPNIFEPPFTSCFDEYFNITGTSIFHTSNSTDTSYDGSFILIMSILVAGLDIIYSIIRVFFAGIYMGFIICGFGVLGALLYVTVNRRWKIVPALLDPIKLNLVW